MFPPSQSASTEVSRRRWLLASAGVAAGSAAAAEATPPNRGKRAAARPRQNSSGTFTTKDGTTLYYKDWGAGQAVAFSHGWPLSSDAFESQMYHLAANGFRCIAHDRRGHGRSSQPWNGNNMDTYADDLHELLTALDVQKVALIGHSAGGGEVARYIGRHGTSKVSHAVLISAVTPYMLQTPANPTGLPMSVFDGFRKAYLANRAQFFLDIATGSFFGFNRPGVTVSDGLIRAWHLQGMLSSHKGAYDCIQAFSETDFTEDLKKFSMPTMIVHGDDDQVVPINISSVPASKLVKGSVLKVYKGGSHALTDTSKDQLNADLLAFLRS